MTAHHRVPTTLVPLHQPAKAARAARTARADADTLSLFGAGDPAVADLVAIEAAAARQVALGQYYTPLYAAEALVESTFPDLTAADLVIEPTCGDGAFLAAIAPSVRAVGVEIDPVQAALARERTGREVRVGDFRTVDLADLRPTAMVGNLPFQMDVIEGVLARAHRLLPEGARAGFILPVHVLQTPARVMDLRERWSIETQLIPRSLWPRLRFALQWAVFTKDRRRRIVGMCLFEEVHAVQRFERRFREMLERSRQGAWRTAVYAALETLGGEATLPAICELLEGRRPTPNQFWRDKVRQICVLHHERVDRGRYRLRRS